MTARRDSPTLPVAINAAPAPAANGRAHSYESLVGRLRMPSPAIIADWPEFVHPHRPAEDPPWREIDEQDADAESVAAWLRRILSRLPAAQRGICAALAVRDVLAVWEGWADRQPTLRASRSVPRASLERVHSFLCNGGWRPSLDEPRAQVAQLAAMLAARPTPLTIGPAPRAILAAIDEVFAFANGDEAAAWRAVWQCIRAEVWAGIRFIGSHRATRRASFVQRWWRRCRCCLAFAEPESSQLVR